MLKLLKSIGDSLFGMPDLEQYGIPKQPSKMVDVKHETKTTKHNVVDGKLHKTITKQDGVIETIIGKEKPKSTSEVTIDKFDVAGLEWKMGSKWHKNKDRAAVMKWHWLNEHSALQIEQYHTDKSSKEIERGYSERSAAPYIAAFYQGDNLRHEAGKQRLRDATRETEPQKKQSTSNVTDWESV